MSRLLNFYRGEAADTEGRRVDEVWAWDDDRVEPLQPRRPAADGLRITQVLRCLSVLGLGSEAHALFEWLDCVYSSRRFPILDDTFRYWADAVRERH